MLTLRFKMLRPRPKRRLKPAPAVVVQTADPPLKKKTKAPSEVATPKVAAAAKKKTTKAPGGSEPKKLRARRQMDERVGWSRLPPTGLAVSTFQTK
ncbi:hypothetical protein PGTUg99_001268 [Puccinia graminis f. sp. tritici]|uniref:Uncharacterized protein n=1 Tax=Puccinia graminis f. sp. tritici TaxID=56615 RepID=A0A5B0M1Q6_PUCGR|nr:hypothetical protein PGTUg99_001268 [Puccinia graminis f. sp. tritici]